MDIKTAEQLMQVDERATVLAYPRLENDLIALTNRDLASIQHMIAYCDLVSAVPTHVQHLFETCRKLHTYGSFAYEFFTVAAERAYFVVEAALGAKFLEYYSTGIPLENERGAVELLQ